MNYLVSQKICLDADLATRLIREENKGFQGLDNVYDSCSFCFLILILQLNFHVATKSLKSTRTYQQCQLSLLHEDIRQ